MEIEINEKKLAGEKAADFIRDGMTVGLGTWSTVYWTIKRVGERVKEGLKIHCIPTSKKTEQLAAEMGIPLIDFSQARELDVTIDGADEIDSQLNLIKGGGGALLREKLVAAASRRFIVVAEHSKCVPVIGTFPVPIEVIPFAWEVTAERISKLKCIPKLRSCGHKPYVTDNSNYILDCECDSIRQPSMLHELLKLLPGVVETGLFVQMTDTVIIGSNDCTKVISK